MRALFIFWPFFVGHFSDDIYVLSRALVDIIARFVEEIKASGFPRMQNEESSNIHGSSADLFVFYKNCMTQCMQLFPSPILLVKLSTTFQKYLKEYAGRVLNSNLPK
jgi:hypothetical protein